MKEFVRKVVERIRRGRTSGQTSFDPITLVNRGAMAEVVEEWMGDYLAYRQEEATQKICNCKPEDLTETRAMLKAWRLLEQDLALAMGRGAAAREGLQQMLKATSDQES
jgi:hypothetical protein